MTFNHATATISDFIEQNMLMQAGAPTAMTSEAMIAEMHRLVAEIGTIRAIWVVYAPQSDEAVRAKFGQLRAEWEAKHPPAEGESYSYQLRPSPLAPRDEVYFMDERVFGQVEAGEEDWQRRRAARRQQEV